MTVGKYLQHSVSQTEPNKDAYWRYCSFVYSLLWCCWSHSETVSWASQFASALMALFSTVVDYTGSARKPSLPRDLLYADDCAFEVTTLRHFTNLLIIIIIIVVVVVVGSFWGWYTALIRPLLYGRITLQITVSLKKTEVMLQQRNRYSFISPSITARDVELPFLRQMTKQTKTSTHVLGHFTLTSVCVRALPVGHCWSQTNIRGVVAELLDTVAKHRFV